MVQDGVPTLGTFTLPALGDLYHTDGKISWYNGVALTPPASAIDANAVFLISEGAYRHRNIDYTGKVLSLGSAAAHLCYIARAAAVGSLDQASIWDYTAGAAILRVLGMPFRYVSGAEVDFTRLYSGQSTQEPTLVCPPRHFQALQTALLQSG